MPDIFRTYKEMVRLPTFKERFDYIKLGGVVGKATFGANRYLNQSLYRSIEWKRFRDKVIIRDNGCDLGIPERPILLDKIIIHHIAPLTVNDLKERSEMIFDMNNVVCVSFYTHQAIHFGDERLLPRDPVIRRPNDTCPWKI